MLKKLLSISSVLLLIAFNSAYARPVTIEFTATVDWVDDYGNALNGEVIAGQTITGSYSFDTSLPDSDSYPDSAIYTYPAPIPSGIGFNLNVGNLTFAQSSSTSSDFNIHVYNTEGGGDSFGAVTCCGNAGKLSNGTIVNDIYLDLYSAGIDVISTTSLDDAVSVVDKFLYRMFGIYGTDNNGNWYSINAQITSIAEQGTVSSCDTPKKSDGKFGFKARVDNVYTNSTKPALFKFGDILSGNYNFDPNLVDLDPSSERAFYESNPNNTLGNIEINIAGSTVSSDPNANFINIMMTNFESGQGYDQFDIMSSNSSIQLPDGSVINDIGIGLFDQTGSAINSTSLSEGIPTSISGWQHSNMFIYGTYPDGSYFYVNATIEEINNGEKPVTQPTSAAQVSPASGPVVAYQNFDVGIVVDAGYQPINFIDATMTNKYGETRYMICNPGATGIDSRQTVICPDVSSSFVPGTNTLTAVIHFIDGSQISTTTDWEVVGY